MGKEKTIQSHGKQNSGFRKGASGWSAFAARNGQSGILSEEGFLHVRQLEWLRAERSGKPLMLMLMDVGNLTHGDRYTYEELMPKVLSAVENSTRETDVIGWYKMHTLVGALLTEIDASEIETVPDRMSARVREELQENLGIEKANRISICFHLFPEDGGGKSCHPKSQAKAVREFAGNGKSKRVERGIKRALDIGASFSALILLAPVLLAIALAVKLTSKGPILFRQKRIGRHGNFFQFLKFRSMVVDNDSSEHKEYVRRFIRGKAKPSNGDAVQEEVFKLTNDPRITPVGRFLRRTSLDELPQFWNVLKGEMSLVGPRPALPYEFDTYDLWHKRRVWEMKPGITGLWQVSARSKTSFDEMVRLDIRYVNAWSLWLDLRLLLKTPKVVLSGEGAY